jgi:hypothetical protein
MPQGLGTETGQEKIMLLPHGTVIALVDGRISNFTAIPETRQSPN